MEQIWAPWRMDYLRSESRPESCFFCTTGANSSEETDLVVWRGDTVYALLNRYPYANAHVMVVPYAHEGRLEALPCEVLHEIMTSVALIIRALRRAYSPEGFNVGANLGTAAGAGFGDHLHIHVVPRWHSDTNFMTTTSGTRVIPETLADSARNIRAALSSLELEEGATP
jgi:ATP adenylyltransferase